MLHKEKIVVAHMEQCPKLFFYVSKHGQRKGSSRVVRIRLSAVGTGQ